MIVVEYVKLDTDVVSDVGAVRSVLLGEAEILLLFDGREGKSLPSTSDPWEPDTMFDYCGLGRFVSITGPCFLGLGGGTTRLFETMDRNVSK